ncbi:MAG TPA: hypothetical protein VI278_02380 [Nitrososphaeraceae archaeon]
MFLDPVGVGQVYFGGGDGNVHVKLPSSLRVGSSPPAITHARMKAASCSTVAPAGNLKSYKIFKRKGLTVDNVEWFANAIETGIIKLPELQYEGQIVKIYTIS